MLHFWIRIFCDEIIRGLDGVIWEKSLVWLLAWKLAFTGTQPGMKAIYREEEKVVCFVVIGKDIHRGEMKGTAREKSPNRCFKTLLEKTREWQELRIEKLHDDADICTKEVMSQG